MKRTIAGAFAAFAAAFALAACSSPAAEETKEDTAPAEVTQSEAPAKEEPAEVEQSAEEAPVEEEPAQSEADSSAAAPSTTTVALVAPGEHVKGRGNAEFVNFEDKKAVFSHEVVSIDPAPEADVAALVAEIPQIKGMKVYYINVDSRFVEGENLEFSAFYSDLRASDADGNPVQEITLIGWDNCKSNSIPKGGGTPDEPIMNCFAAAVPEGGNEPVGVMWAPYDSPYDMYDGQPAVFELAN